MAKLLRVNKIYGQGNPIPVGKTVFWESYVHDEAGPEVQHIPGTNVEKLKLVHIGLRARAGFDDEVAALVEALRAERDQRFAASATITTRPGLRDGPPQTESETGRAPAKACRSVKQPRQPRIPGHGRPVTSV